MSEQDLDTKLIECHFCKDVLNLKSLWIGIIDGQGDEPVIYCEACKKKLDNNESQGGVGV
jgi:hypothetical protein